MIERRVRILAWSSVVFIMLADVIFYFGHFLLFRLLPDRLNDQMTRWFIYHANKPIQGQLELITNAVAIFFLLGLSIFVIGSILRIKSGLPLGRSFVATLILLLLSFPALSVTASSIRLWAYRLMPSAGPEEISTNVVTWKSYAGPAGGQYSLKLPKEMTLKQFGRIPGGGVTEYVDLVPKDVISGMKKYELFEVILSKESNEGMLKLEEKINKINTEMKKYSRSYSILSSVPLVVSGVEGIREEILIDGPEGWQRYSRISIPYKGNFFIIKGILGGKKEIPEYRKVFDLMVSTFAIKK